MKIKHTGVITSVLVRIQKTEHTICLLIPHASPLFLHFLHFFLQRIRQEEALYYAWSFCQFEKLSAVYGGHIKFSANRISRPICQENVYTSGSGIYSYIARTITGDHLILCLFVPCTVVYQRKTHFLPRTLIGIFFPILYANRTATLNSASQICI